MMLKRLSVSVLCLALVLGVVTTIAAGDCSAYPDCPDVNTAHSGTHSSTPYCIAHPSLDCSAQKNYNCPPCELWRNIQSGGPCNKHHYSPVQGSKNPEWIIEPCFAVSGIESILDNSQAAKTNFLWGQAWSDAVQGTESRTQIPSTELGLVINSFYYRSRHQMHIHAAKLDRNFAQYCLGSLPTTIKTTWESPTNKSKCNFNMVSKYTNSLSNVNSMIIDGAAKLGIDSKKTGALVSANPFGSSGYTVTVFEGYRGDHEILYYN